MNDKPMKFKVKGSIRDLLAFKNLVKKRAKIIDAAPATFKETPWINALAARLHPELQHLVIKEIIDETKTCRTFRLVPDGTRTRELAYFQAGQYLSLKLDVNGFRITRPYSISSGPADALKGFYDLTIRKLEGGFATEFIWNTWKAGDAVTASSPMGQMYHSPIRDGRSIVALAGGSGITPFRSMAREICYGKLDASLKLIYGCADDAEILFHEELRELAKKYPDRFSFVMVMSCEETSVEGCEKGFITRSVIEKHSNPAADSYFICGPDVMYDFAGGELAALGVPPKRTRREAYGEIKKPARFPDYPHETSGKTFSITVQSRQGSVVVPASGSESVLVALERAKLAPPSACRSGECQFCRTLLLRGDVWVGPECDGRRAADKETGYIHPCASFPVSDLELVLPENGEHRR
jgi:glycine betaine catabolism B